MKFQKCKHFDKDGSERLYKRTYGLNAGFAEELIHINNFHGSIKHDIVSVSGPEMFALCPDAIAKKKEIMIMIDDLFEHYHDDIKHMSCYWNTNRGPSISNVLAHLINAHVVSEKTIAMIDERVAKRIIADMIDTYKVDRSKFPLIAMSTI